MYTQAPLPFRGQKRGWNKHVRSIIAGARAAGITTVVDLFGGSGLLSRIVKDTDPALRVVYNDYDHYVDRIALIPRTNAILAELRHILATVPPKARIPLDVKQRVDDVLRRYEQTGPVDYITLSASLLFSGKWKDNHIGFVRQSYYACPPKADYRADGYLDGLEVRHEDYRTLFAEFRGRRDVLFLIDPPYLQTESEGYKTDAYLRLGDYLDIVRLMDDTRFVAFSSDKSDLVDLFRWLDGCGHGFHLLEGAEIYRRKLQIGATRSFTDILMTNLPAAS